MHGTRGICRDEFDVYFFILAKVAAAVFFAALLYVEQYIGVISVAEREVYKSGTATLQDSKYESPRSIYFETASAIFLGAVRNALAQANAAFTE